MITKYQIFKDVNLEVIKFFGTWNSGDFEKYLQKISVDVDRESIERILVDLRKVKFDMTTNVLGVIVKLREEYIQKKYTIVHLVEDPIVTAQSHLYQEKLKEKALKYNYCSTIEYAVQLLGLEYTRSEMENIIENLEKQVE